MTNKNFDLNSLEENYNRNLLFFKERMPEIYEQIIKNKTTPALTIDPVKNTLHLKYKGENLYIEGAKEYAINEVNVFLKRFNNITYKSNFTQLEALNLVKRHAFKNTLVKYRKSCEKSDNKPFRMDLAVFGIGLGFHIKELSKQDYFNHITIIEKDFTNFTTSLYTFRWDSLLLELKGGRHISFFIKNLDQDDEAFNSEIKQHCYHEFPAIVSSILIYNHEPFKYQYIDIKDQITEFSTHMQLMYENIENDGRRVFNACQNIYDKHILLNLESSSINIENKKVAIIGGGPSLEYYAPIIRDNRHDFYVISAGTGLSSLLPTGIIPDLHFELEFRNATTKVLNHVSTEFSIEDIPLMCTFEAHPSITRLFKRVYMYAPPSSELSKFIPQRSILTGGGVTCTNSAAAIAEKLTDNDIYLFGSDFAYTDGHHHSKNNIHNQNTNSKDLEELKNKNSSPIATIPVKSVINETIYTVPHLNSARMAMEALIKESNNKFYNCSNGANIRHSHYINKENLLASINNDKTVTPSTINFIPEDTSLLDLNNNYKKLITFSINESKSILELIKKHNDKDSILNTINKILKNAYIYNPGNIHQYRSIMGIIRFPLLILYNSINFSPERDKLKIYNTWKKEYKRYTDYLEKILITRLENNDFYIEDSWIEKKKKSNP